MDSKPSLFLFVMDNRETLIKAIKQQAEIFLLDARELFPFGTYIGKENQVIPIAAYIEDENDRPESKQLTEMLENSIKRGLVNGDYLVGALAFDAFLNEDGKRFDSLIIRIYENDKMTKKSFKYYIHENHVEFI